MTAFVLFLGAIIAQATVFQAIKEYGISFDGVLAVAVVLGFMRGNYQRLLLPAFLSGIILDSMSGAPFGSVTVALMVSLVVLSALSGILPREHIPHFFIFAIIGSVVFSATAFFLTRILGSVSHMSVGGVLFTIGYNVAGTILVYFFARWIILLKNRISGR